MTKTKNKIYLLAVALFFLMGAGSVRADDCVDCVAAYDDYNICISQGYCASTDVYSQNDPYFQTWEDTTLSYTYNECIADGGDYGYCTSFPGAPGPVYCPDGDVDFMTNTCVASLPQLTDTYLVCKDFGGDEQDCGDLPGAPARVNCSGGDDVDLKTNTCVYTYTSCIADGGDLGYCSSFPKGQTAVNCPTGTDVDMMTNTCVASQYTYTDCIADSGDLDYCSSFPKGQTAVNCPTGTDLDFMTNTCVASQNQIQYTYIECKKDGGDEAYCGGFPGAPASAVSLNGAASGNCSHNSDCGSGYTCYQQSCLDDATYDANVSWYSGFGNNVSQVFTSGGSVFSDNGTASPETLATIQQATMLDGKTIPAGSRIMTDGSVRDANYNQILPPNSVPAPTGGGSGSSFVMCANGILAPECRDANGNNIGGTPLVVVPGAVAGANNRVNRVAGPKCGTDGTFQDIGGVCFPTNTGLSDAPIYVILSNLFSWLMGLFTTFAVLAFVVSGIQYFMSSGDESMAEKAKENAKNAMIGIIVGLSGFIIIKAIASALSGTGYLF